VLKEACILSLSSSSPLLQHFAFKPPHPLRLLSAHDMRQVDYSHQTLGVLQWSVGTQEVGEFIACLPTGSIVLCNGLEKSLLLQALFPLSRVVNVNTSFGPLTSATNPFLGCLPCPFGFHKMCALLRVYQLHQYLTNNNNNNNA